MADSETAKSGAVKPPPAVVSYAKVVKKTEVGLQQGGGQGLAPTPAEARAVPAKGEAGVERAVEAVEQPVAGAGAGLDADDPERDPSLGLSITWLKRLKFIFVLNNKYSKHQIYQI